MKDKIKIAVVNFHAKWGDKSNNLSAIEEYCNIAGKNKVNLILFPETCLNGYDNDKNKPFEEKMHIKTAETIPGESSLRLSNIAKKYNMYIVYGMAEKAFNQNSNEAKIYNSAAIIYPDGKIESYRKIHLPFDEKEWACPADKPKMIKSPWGNIGVSICYDTYCFPELIRFYRSKKARLILNVTACPDINCTMAAATLSLPAYAYINYVFIASSNLCGQDKFNYFPGGSNIIGPDNTKKGVKVYTGIFFGEKNSNKEGIFIGEIDLALADKYNDIPIFSGDWQPLLYQKWLDKE